MQQLTEIFGRVASEPGERPVTIEQRISAEQWNSYLREFHAGSLFHRWEWQQVYEVYGLRFHRLAALRDGKVVGVLPLVWQRSRLFGNQLVSLPWFDAAGVMASDSDVADALINAARDLASVVSGTVLQLRQAERVDTLQHVRTDKVLMRLNLPRDPDDLWKSFKPTVRNQIRKAEKLGLKIQCGHQGLIPEFYKVYSHNMRDLGSPPHKRPLFERTLEVFGKDCSVYVVRLNGEAVAGGLTIRNGKCLEIPWASSLRKFNRYCVNNLMYWSVLRDACNEGFEWFHFGRSTRDSGPYRFKKQWGAEPQQLYWYYESDDQDTLRSLMAPEETFGWGRRVWRRLPVGLARRLGPHIIARVP